MPNYRRLPIAVEAWQYTGQPREEWPSWVADYKAQSPMGEQGIGAQWGDLMIPTTGTSMKAANGNWLVKDGKTIVVLTEGDFHAEFEEYTPTEAVAGADD